MTADIDAAFVAWSPALAAESFSLMRDMGRDQAVLFDAPDMERAEAWGRVLESADAIVAARDQALVCLLWLVRMGERSHCAFVHFCSFTPDRERARAGCLAGLRLIRNAGLECLVGITPQPWRHVRRFAREVGFAEQGMWPGMLWLERYGRTVPGAVLVLDFEKTGALPPHSRRGKLSPPAEGYGEAEPPRKRSV